MVADSSNVIPKKYKIWLDQSHPINATQRHQKLARAVKKAAETGTSLNNGPPLGESCDGLL